MKVLIKSYRIKNRFNFVGWMEVILVCFYKIFLKVIVVINESIFFFYKVNFEYFFYDNFIIY